MHMHMLVKTPSLKIMCDLSYADICTWPGNASAILQRTFESTCMLLCTKQARSHALSKPTSYHKLTSRYVCVCGKQDDPVLQSRVEARYGEIWAWHSRMAQAGKIGAVPGALAPGGLLPPDTFSASHPACPGTAGTATGDLLTPCMKLGPKPQFDLLF